MARKVELIYNEIIAEKQTLNSLNGLLPSYNLTPPAENAFVKLLNEIATLSKVGSWRLTAYIVAVTINLFEQLQDIFKAEIETIAAQAIAGTVNWYAAQVLRFQSGYALIFDNTNYRYFYSDTTSAAAVAARVVKKVAIQELITSQFNGIVIKVAKEQSPNVLEPLSNAEVIELVSYINKVKFAGVQTSVISLAADLIRLNLTVYYDGVLDINDFKNSVEAAINNYLNGIDFDGIFYVNELVDALQAVPGLFDIELFNVSAKADTEPLFSNVSRLYNPASGYFELVAIGSGTNNTIINYVAQ
jgi:hypothetical protein